ncbi:MAG: hypothetical protein RLO12_10765 [Fulvivirga sp.]
MSCIQRSLTPQKAELAHSLNALSNLEREHLWSQHDSRRWVRLLQNIGFYRKNPDYQPYEDSINQTVYRQMRWRSIKVSLMATRMRQFEMHLSDQRK